MSGQDIDDNIITWDGASYDVTTSDQFMLQNAEGCCYVTTQDNTGHVCAQIYFLYGAYIEFCILCIFTLLNLFEMSLHNRFIYTAETPEPTANPTQPPTFKNCNDVDEVKNINWNLLANPNGNDNSAEIPYTNFSISFDENTLELTFDIELEYLGTSYDANSNQYGLGTTYVIDFQSFGTKGDYINQPGNCQNRLATSFDGITDFDSLWTFRYDQLQLHFKYYYSRDPLNSDRAIIDYKHFKNQRLT